MEDDEEFRRSYVKLPSAPSSNALDRVAANENGKARENQIVDIPTDVQETRQQTSTSSFTLSASKAMQARRSCCNCCCVSPTCAILASIWRPDTFILLLGSILGAVAAVAQAWIPRLVGDAVNTVSSTDSDDEFDDVFSRSFRWTLIALGAAVGTCAFFGGARGAVFTIATARFNQRLRRELFRALLRQDVAVFDSVHSGDVTSRLASDTSTFTGQACLNLNVVIRTTVQIATVLTLMFSSNVRLSCVTLSSVPCMIAFINFFGRRLARLSETMQAELGHANEVAQEALGSMHTVKSFALEESMRTCYDRRLDTCQNLSAANAVMYGCFTILTNVLPNAMTVAVIWLSARLVRCGDMDAGALFSFLLYQQELTGALQGMSEAVSSMSSAMGAGARVAQILLDSPSSSAIKDSTQENQALPGFPVFSASADDTAACVAFDNVSFAYPTRPDDLVLRDFTWHIPAGQFAAIVGSSGSGKSTLAKLLQKLYTPSTGIIRIDGISLSDYHDARAFYKILSHVPQEPVMFARTIRQNIALGFESSEDGISCTQPHDAVEAVSRMAHAHEFIAKLPDGYDTYCGEKGVRLSGGQKQRLALARALLRRPRIIVLDEATSALDAVSEKCVQAALLEMAEHKKCTLIVIAHRLSTIRRAENIVVLRDGVLAEMGCHDALAKQGGAYAELISL